MRYRVRGLRPDLAAADAERGVSPGMCRRALGAVRGTLTAVNDQNTSSAAPTVRDRTGWLPPDRLADHFERGTLLLDGVPVTDLDQPAPAGTRIVVSGR